MPAASLPAQNGNIPATVKTKIILRAVIVQTILGLEFTLQCNNSYIKLIHMGARWYDPQLGRFTQPDTIIPGPGNPLAWDRFHYALNSPAVFKDPSGHAPQCHSADGFSCKGLGGSSNPITQEPPPNVPSTANGDSGTENVPEEVLEARFRSVLNHYGVKLSGTWEFKYIEAIYLAVLMVGNTFADLFPGYSAAEAFRLAFGGVNFTFGDAGASSPGCSGVTGGGCTSGPHQINFWSMSGDSDDTMFRRIKNVVHELGHAYNGSHGDPAGYMPNDVFTNARENVLRPNMSQGIEVPGYWDWQQSPQTTRSEVFADMFVAWVFNAWNTDPANSGQVASAKDWMYSLGP